MDMRKIGAFISELRKSKNFTQAELAQELGVSHQAVSKWERGESLPDIGLLPSAARLLGVTVDELLSGERTADASGGAAQQKDIKSGDEDREADAAAETSGNPPQPLTVEQIGSLAPFVSREALEAMVERAQGDINWEMVSAVAPFLGRATLEKLVGLALEEPVNGHRIASLAPFLGTDLLDRLVSRAEESSLDWEVISGLGPFLARDTLTRLVERAADGAIDPSRIAGLAPFIPQELLDRLILGARL